MKTLKKGLKILNPQLVKPQPVKLEQPTLTQNIDPHRRKHKTGPQLLLTRILMENGALTSKQIWRSYQRMMRKSTTLPENGEDISYFRSLTKLKKTLGFMRKNQKIKSNGYNRKEREFKGWKLNQERALKYVHPSVIEGIREKIKRKDQL